MSKLGAFIFYIAMMIATLSLCKCTNHSMPKKSAYATGY